MGASDDDRDPVEELAEEFLARRRRGERPAVSDYAVNHPHLADQIRDLFPALSLLEDLADRPAGVLSASPAAGSAPGRLGEYRVLREVGRGGRGIVYEAEQESMGRRVALKVLAARALGDERKVRSFERELSAAARLRHANMVPIVDVGRDGATHYYVMPFIDGVGLDRVLDDLRLLRDAPCATAQPTADEVTRSLFADCLACNAFAPNRRTWCRAASIGVQAAEALAHAHARGLVHGNVKPSNLLLDARGTVRVTDFGLAGSLEVCGLTEGAEIGGTVRYTAPERFDGKCDGRSDVYSLGLTLYELLVLRPAYEDANRNRAVKRILREDPPRPRQVNRTVPRDLEAVVLKAAAREPAERYQTANELVDDLKCFLEGRAVRARRAPLLERLWRWARRHLAKSPRA
jgi:serine/threonine protein kinase